MRKTSQGIFFSTISLPLYPSRVLSPLLVALAHFLGITHCQWRKVQVLPTGGAGGNTTIFETRPQLNLSGSRALLSIITKIH